MVQRVVPYSVVALVSQTTFAFVYGGIYTESYSSTLHGTSHSLPTPITASSPVAPESSYPGSRSCRQSPGSPARWWGWRWRSPTASWTSRLRLSWLLGWCRAEMWRRGFWLKIMVYVRWCSAMVGWRIWWSWLFR